MNFILDHHYEQVLEWFEEAIASFDEVSQAYLREQVAALDPPLQLVSDDDAKAIIKYIEQVVRSGPTEDELAWALDEAARRLRPWKS